MKSNLINSFISKELDSAKYIKNQHTYYAKNTTKTYYSLYSEACDHIWIASYLKPYLSMVNSLDIANNLRHYKIYYISKNRNVLERQINEIISSIEDLHHFSLTYHTNKLHVYYNLHTYNAQVIFQMVNDKPTYYTIIENNCFYICELFDDLSNVELISTSCMRAIRCFFILDCINKGGFLYHCSAVSIDDKAYLFSGDKFSGKTTTMIKLLQEKKGNLITNDQAIIFPDSNIILGLPIAIGVRNNTIKNYPKLSKYINFQYAKLELSRSTANFISINKSVPKIKKNKIIFSPNEIASIFNVSLISHANIAKIFFLEYEPQLENFKIFNITTNKVSDKINSNIIPYISYNQPFWNVLISKKNYALTASKLHNCVSYTKLSYGNYEYLKDFDFGL